MFKGFTKTKDQPRGPARGAPGKRCYAIGDVHGRLDLLEDLLVRIEADHRRRPAKETALVFLGDLIDRGPHSREVVERLMDRPPGFCRAHFIMGNHEEILVRGLSGEPSLLTDWLTHGGYECAQSFGAPAGRLLGAAAEQVEQVLAAQIPDRHLRFMAGFLDTIQFGDYLFAHAGVRPGIPLDAQGRDVRWIREGFLDSDADLGWVVVHGHTITRRVEERPNRIGIDTGAYQSGVLTAIRIEDEARDYIQTGAAAM